MAHDAASKARFFQLLQTLGFDPKKVAEQFEERDAKNFRNGVLPLSVFAVQWSRRSPPWNFVFAATHCRQTEGGGWNPVHDRELDLPSEVSAQVNPNVDHRD